MSILSELKAATGLDRGPNESDHSYARRLAQAVACFSDEVWKKLKDPTQEWVNGVLQAIHDNKELPNLHVLSPPAQAAKPVKAPVKKSKEKKPDTRPIMTTGSIDRKARIRILVAENPHKKDTRAWWAFSYYRDGMTVQEAYNRCVGWTNIVWDQSNGYIKLESE